MNFSANNLQIFYIQTVFEKLTLVMNFTATRRLKTPKDSKTTKWHMYSPKTKYTTVYVFWNQFKKWKT